VPPAWNVEGALALSAAVGVVVSVPGGLLDGAAQAQPALDSGEAAQVGVGEVPCVAQPGG